MTARPTLGQVLRTILSDSDALRLSPHQWKTVRALAACRTGALGGQLFHCAHCQREHFVAHSCRNRHCPQCQGGLAADWLERQEAALLPIPYFHLVFTLPHVLNGLLRQNRRALFTLLFNAASQTLLEFGQGRLGAQIGVTAVLHTWSQTLLDHYHLHCIVTGGGVGLNKKRWVRAPGHYLFPVKALSRMFRGKFLAGLNRWFEADALEFHGQLEALRPRPAFTRLLQQAARTPWVVYAKRPFAGPRQVLAYLSRYTHRVAISHRRLQQADAQRVTFTYKDYARDARSKTMTLETPEFIRRFCLHILPERFVKIRHYGLLGNRQRAQRLDQARQLLAAARPANSWPRPGPPTPGRGQARQLLAAARPAKEMAAPIPRETPPERCPFCQQPTLRFVREVPPERARRPAPLDSS